MAASGYTYTYVPNSLRKFLKGVPDRGVPSKVDAAHLKSIGLKEQADKSIIRVLKFSNLLNNDGSPAQAYKDFRDKSKGPSVLAREIGTAYKELFDTYPDAYTQGDENLRNFFSGKTNLGADAIRLIIGTFKVLCEFGDFSDAQAATSSVSPIAHLQKGTIAPHQGQGGGPDVHINLQIYLPENVDVSAYDAIFAAINRHLGKLM